MKTRAWMNNAGRVIPDSTLDAIKQVRPGAEKDWPTPLIEKQPDAYYEGRVWVALAFLDRLLDPEDLGFAVTGEVRGIAKQLKKEIGL